MLDAEERIDIYVDTWNESDSGRRQGLMEKVWVDDGYYADPAVEARGRCAISDNIDRVHRKYPDRIFCRTSDVYVRDDRARFKWAIVDPAGSAILAGVHYVQFASDGRLRRVLGIYERTAHWPTLAKPVIHTSDPWLERSDDTTPPLVAVGAAERFDTDTQVSALGEGRFDTEIRPGWTAAGGGPCRGYLLAVMLAATGATVPELRALTATAHWLEPIDEGPAELAVELAGGGTVCARLTQDGADRARLLAGYADPTRLGERNGSGPQRPNIPGPDDCVAAPPGGVPVLRRFDLRVISGGHWEPGERADRTRLDGWIRFADGRAPDLACLPLLVDAFPSPAHQVIDPGRLWTVELNVHMRHDPAPGWIQARCSTRALDGAVVEDDVELWDADAKLVASCRRLAMVQPSR